MYFSLEMRDDAVILRFLVGVEEAVQLCMVTFYLSVAETSDFPDQVGFFN